MYIVLKEPLDFEHKITIKSCYNTELELLSWNDKLFVLDDSLYELFQEPITRSFQLPYLPSESTLSRIFYF